MILNKIAHQILSTWNPSTRLAASKMSNPLMMKVNNPSVKMLRGRVSKTNIGFIAMLISDKMSPAKRAVGKSNTITPGKM